MPPHLCIALAAALLLLALRGRKVVSQLLQQPTACFRSCSSAACSRSAALMLRLGRARRCLAAPPRLRPQKREAKAWSGCPNWRCRRCWQRAHALRPRQRRCCSTGWLAVTVGVRWRQDADMHRRQGGGQLGKAPAEAEGGRGLLGGALAACCAAISCVGHACMQRQGGAARSSRPAAD